MIKISVYFFYIMIINVSMINECWYGGGKVYKSVLWYIYIKGVLWSSMPPRPPCDISRLAIQIYVLPEFCDVLCRVLFFFLHPRAGCRHIESFETKDMSRCSALDTKHAMNTFNPNNNRSCQRWHAAALGVVQPGMFTVY